MDPNLACQLGGEGLSFAHDMRPSIIGLLGHAEVLSFEEFGVGGIGQFEGGIGKPEVQALEEDGSDDSPGELMDYWKSEVLDGQFISPTKIHLYSDAVFKL